MSPLTLAQIALSICPTLRKNRDFLLWPPDVFAICASILRISGAYVQVLDQWPPHANAGHWSKTVREDAKGWSLLAGNYGQWWIRTGSKKAGTRSTMNPPTRVRNLWDAIWRRRKLRPHQIKTNRALAHQLLELMALADESCVGLGFARWFDDVKLTLFQKVCNLRLDGKRNNAEAPSSLGIHVHWSRAIVLPKMSTPQSGVTLRALTHHLALISTNEIMPRWRFVNFREEKDSLDLLVIPWPFTLTRASFQKVARTKQTAANLPKNHGQFEIELEKLDESATAELREIIRCALEEAPWVDLVVLPELAFKDLEDYRSVCHMVLDGIVARRKRQIRPGSQFFVIAGVGSDRNNQPCNQVVTSLFYCQSSSKSSSVWLVEEQFQQKHHNWKIDERQIYSYGLKYHLPPDRSWWEKNYLNERRLNFHLAYDWLNFCVVVCEDLARPDPTAEIIRAVGPNLVIALLMDGPQISARWPARHATVLAEDPGSSVLTLTSLGMTKLSCPHGSQQSREIALWKEWNGKIVPIQLPTEASAVLMHLNKTEKEEWTADGRGDECTTVKALLKGIIPIIVPNKRGANAPSNSVISKTD